MKYNYNYNIIIVILLVISIILFNSFTKIKLGFQNKDNNISQNWTSDLIKRFNIYQTTMNKNKTYFDMEILQKQASPDEV
jgi:hypothetical protein